MLIIRDANHWKLWEAMYIYPGHLGISMENQFQDVILDRKLALRIEEGAHQVGRSHSCSCHSFKLYFPIILDFLAP